MDDLLSALYSFPGGYLSDRFGAKRSLLIFNLISMAGYLIVIFVQTWWAVLLGAAFFISWSAISLPATMELVARIVPKTKRAMGVSMHSLIRRIPKMLGPVLGGTFILFWGVDHGVRFAFAAALGLAVFRWMPLFAVLTLLVGYQLVSGLRAARTQGAGPQARVALAEAPGAGTVLRSTLGATNTSTR